MSVGVPAMQTPVRRGALLAGPVLCGCAVLGAAAYVAVIDPAAPAAHLPSCPLYELTGLWCPACGMTRATHALLRGDVAAALGYNLLLPLFLGAIAVGWLAWVRAALGRAPIRWLRRTPTWSVLVVAGVLAVFTVLRNLTPFAALAP